MANYRMFGKKISEFYRARKRGQRGWGVCRGGDGEGELGGLWVHDHPEMAAENKKLYADFRRELAAEGACVFDFSDAFADLTHVNSDGAGAFTRLINETVLRG